VAPPKQNLVVGQHDDVRQVAADTLLWTPFGRDELEGAPDHAPASGTAGERKEDPA
jgi:hypothetical protein